MPQKTVNQWLNTVPALDDSLEPWFESFLMDRKVQNMSAGTLYYYRAKLKLFAGFCDGQVISRISQITPDTIRRYLAFLEQSGHNPGGIHQGYRVLKTFLYWWEAETEPEGWKNPIRKVKAPRVPLEAVQPVDLSTVEHLIAACKGTSLTAVRDRALLLFLLDTGARAAEVCALNMVDIDAIGGGVQVLQGKGRKPRMVFLGHKARRALRAYLKIRPGKGTALWVTTSGERLSYWGLNEIISRRAKAAMVEKPGLHDFRRAFALNFLRNGGDIYSLQLLMGHADLQVLRRYLAQTTEDLQAAHQKASPVDNTGLRT